MLCSSHACGAVTGGRKENKYLIVDGRRVELTTQSAFEVAMRQNGASEIECDGMLTANVRYLLSGPNAPRTGSQCSWVYKRKQAQ